MASLIKVKSKAAILLLSTICSLAGVNYSYATVYCDAVISKDVAEGHKERKLLYDSFSLKKANDLKRSITADIKNIYDSKNTQNINKKSPEVELSEKYGAFKFLPSKPLLSFEVYKKKRYSYLTKEQREKIDFILENKYFNIVLTDEAISDEIRNRYSSERKEITTLVSESLNNSIFEFVFLVHEMEHAIQDLYLDIEGPAHLNRYTRELGAMYAEAAFLLSFPKSEIDKLKNKILLNSEEVIDEIKIIANLNKIKVISLGQKIQVLPLLQLGGYIHSTSVSEYIEWQHNMERGSLEFLRTEYGE